MTNLILGVLIQMCTDAYIKGASMQHKNPSFPKKEQIIHTSNIYCNDKYILEISKKIREIEKK